ncbi:hypothetical protein [Haloarcula montana]|uniref:hypothetical protein n=1 Tax=Haloarcula montana TaxID=3111776 RepID=UPI002D7774D1|nr:hypothetical protein [Haloarcula sp. GH36]
MAVGTAVRVVVTASGGNGAVGTFVPGQMDPSILTDASGLLQGVVSFLLVLAAGWLILVRSPGRVDEAVDTLYDEPVRAVLYGAMAYAVVLLLGLYGVNQIVRIGVGGGRLAQIGVVGIGVAVLVLTGFGFLVLGTLLTDIQRERRPQYGLLVGATLSAVGWILLPLPWSAVVWFGLAAFGIGGSARVWLHTDRTVETERQR